MTTAANRPAVLWEEASECGACGSRDVRFTGAIGSRRYAVCRNCGVERLYDRIAESSLDLLYADYYACCVPEPSTLEKQLANPTFSHRQRRLEGARGSRRRQILEIGCGDGNFLAVLRNAGWEVHGHEVSAATSGLVERRHGIPMVVGAMGAIPCNDQYSVVAAYHVFEHVYHPAEWLDRVRELIEPEGLLHLQIPNAASLTRLASRGLWSALVFPQHVYFYEPRTLQPLLERFGFATLSITTWDPWHGPGTVSTTAVNVINLLIAGRRPWDDVVLDRGARACMPARAARRPLKSVLRGALDRASVVAARLEAAIGRGAVIDVIARVTTRS